MLQLPKSLLRRIALFALSVFFVVAGVNHFVSPDFYTNIMPPYLPAHLELVYLSGVFEIVGGIAVLVPGRLHLRALCPAAVSIRVRRLGVLGHPTRCTRGSGSEVRRSSCF